MEEKINEVQTERRGGSYEIEEKGRDASEERGETGSAWQQASPPVDPLLLPVTNASIRATTSASWGLNYFLIRSFQASLTGSCIMPHNAPYACWTTNTRSSPSASTPRTIFLHRRRPPPPLHRVLLVHLRLPGTLYPREELRVRDCEAYSTQTRGSCLDPLASDSTEYSTSAGAVAYSTCDSNWIWDLNSVWILFVQQYFCTRSLECYVILFKKWYGDNYVGRYIYIYIMSDLLIRYWDRIGMTGILLSGNKVLYQFST